MWGNTYPVSNFAQFLLPLHGQILTQYTFYGHLLNEIYRSYNIKSFNLIRQLILFFDRVVLTDNGS